MTNLTQMSNAALVDAFGQLKAEQAELAKREKALKAALANRLERRNASELDGDLFRLTVSTSYPLVLDTAAVKEMLTDPPMKRSARTTYRVSARVAEAA